MLEVTNVNRRYGSHFAISDVSFTIAQGEVVGLLGPNGAGKTTLMRMLSTFIAPSSGVISYAGTSIEEDPMVARNAVGYLPQRPPLYGDMKVQEYLSFVAKLRGVEKKLREQRISFLADSCDLGGVMQQICGTLSTGFKKRVGLAAALVHSPRVLLLDEPCAGLDPLQRNEFREAIKSLQPFHTILISTHLLHEIKELCSRALILVGGTLVDDLPLNKYEDIRSVEEVVLHAMFDRTDVLDKQVGNL